jgi:NUMOD3 motif-containing protein
VTSKVVESLLSVEFIYCACGCGFTTPKYQFANGKPCKDRPNRFIVGHNNIGKKHSEETKRKIGLAHRGEKSVKWKGDNIRYNVLHTYVRKWFPPPDLCQVCFKVPPKHLANVTGVYGKDIKNWKYMCIKCHYTFDNLIERNLKQYRNKNKVMG